MAGDNGVLGIESVIPEFERDWDRHFGKRGGIIHLSVTTMSRVRSYHTIIDILA